IRDRYDLASSNSIKLVTALPINVRNMTARVDLGAHNQIQQPIRICKLMLKKETIIPGPGTPTQNLGHIMVIDLIGSGQILLPRGNLNTQHATNIRSVEVKGVSPDVCLEGIILIGSRDYVCIKFLDQLQACITCGGEKRRPPTANKPVMYRRVLKVI
ncbi:hypothetical protein U1Q18_007503, partial [Sarracenia purpurea var. burkii]